MVRLEGLGQFKNPMTSSGIEPATFRLVASTNYATAFPYTYKKSQLKAKINQQFSLSRVPI
jgi:hypothetical protein